MVKPEHNPDAGEAGPAYALGPRFAEAVGYVSRLHAEQSRKDTSIPYVSHLLATASLVLEQDGSSEDEAIAGLLHDVIEDQGEQTSLTEIGERFGPTVAQIVEDCTDARSVPKPPWRHRKETYLDHLGGVWAPSLRVSLADKLHNATAIAEEYAQLGDALWSRFNAPPVAQRWYYESLARLFARRLDSPLSQRMGRVVASFVGDLPAKVRLTRMRQRPAWVDSSRVTGQAATLEGVDTSGQDVGAWRELVPDRAWLSADSQWWVELVDAGNPEKPLTVFVAPPDPPMR